MAFQNLKEVISSTQVLVSPNFSMPLVLEIDASHKALGAILIQ